MELYQVEFDTGEKVRLPASKLTVDVDAELAEFERGLQERNDQFASVREAKKEGRRISVFTDTGTEGVDDESPVKKSSWSSSKKAGEGTLVASLKNKGLAAGGDSGKGSRSASPTKGPAKGSGKGAKAVPAKGSAKGG